MPFSSETMKPLNNSLDYSGEFEDVSLIHRSKHGILYFASRNGKRYILKAAASDAGHDLALLKREYELSIKLADPGIVYVYSYEPSSSVGPCIVMEYVDGIPLREFLSQGPSQGERRRIFNRLLDIVSYIHSHGITHNDLSPENILIYGAANDVKLIDFGFADDDTHEYSSALGGTQGYASPELLGGGKVDSRSDIWSLGALMGDIFGNKHSRIRRKCCRQNPEDRFQTVAALKDSLSMARRMPFAILTTASVALCAIAAAAFLHSGHHGTFPEPLAAAPDSTFTADNLPTKAYSREPSDSGLKPVAAQMKSGIEPVVAAAPAKTSSKPVIPTVREKTEIKPVTPAGPSDTEKFSADSVHSGDRGSIGTSSGVTDLSAKETANCYIVSSEGEYSFRADIKGNNSTPMYGTAATAAVLWESFGTMTRPAEGDLIGNVSLEGKYVRFSTHVPMADGNAVIAVKDSSGRILWSWHIWLCRGYDPNASAQVYHNQAGTFLDRNLGATSATPGDIRAIGLIYQRHRKDPFLNTGTFNAQNEKDYPRAASTANWPEPVKSTTETNRHSFLDANPMTYIIGIRHWDDFEKEGGWIDRPHRKSVNDPCPPGWRVPNTDAWCRALDIGNDTVVPPYDRIRHGWDFGADSPLSMGDAGTIWYPANGYVYTGDGQLHHCNGHGTYAEAAIAMMRIAGSKYLLANVKSISLSFAVRCMADDRLTNHNIEQSSYVSPD